LRIIALTAWPLLCTVSEKPTPAPDLPGCGRRPLWIPRYRFVTFTILSSGLRSIILLRGSMPACAGSLSTVTVKSIFVRSTRCFCKYI